MTSSNGATSPRSASLEALLDRLNERRTVEALHQLLDHAELLPCSTDNIRSGLADVRGAIPGESNEVIAQMLSLAVLLPYLPRLVAVAPKFIEMIERLAPFVASQEFDALLSSGVFQPATVKLVGQAGDAFVASYEEQRRHPPKRGLLSLLGALRDPDVQRAAALIVAFGKRFGHSLEW